MDVTKLIIKEAILEGVMIDKSPKDTMRDLHFIKGYEKLIILEAWRELWEEVGMNEQMYSKRKK